MSYTTIKIIKVVKHNNIINHDNNTTIIIIIILMYGSVGSIIIGQVSQSQAFGPGPKQIVLTILGPRSRNFHIVSYSKCKLGYFSSAKPSV